MRLLVVIPTALLLITSACGSNAPRQVIQPTQAIPQPPAKPVVDATSYPTLQAPQVNVNQTASGYQMTLQRAWRDGKQVLADLCYTLPDNSDWTIWSAELDYAGQMITQFGASMLSQQPAADGNPGQRCDELVFSVPPDADLSSASLTVQSLGAQPTQDDYCSTYMPKIQAVLDQRGLGIRLGCTDNNGAMTMQIVSKPSSMSQQDAEKIVYSDEFFTVKGPWTFPVGLGQ
jgi:hypothetical protein